MGLSILVTKTAIISALACCMRKCGKEEKFMIPMCVF